MAPAIRGSRHGHAAGLDRSDMATDAGDALQVARVGADAGPVLLYDGLCGFCDWTVRLVLRADRRRVFRFAPLEGDFARHVLARHADLRGIDSVILLEPSEDGSRNRVHVRSAAVLRTTRYLPGAWGLLGAFALVPRPLRDWAYDVFARNRYRLFRRLEACPIPPREVRSRFLD